MSLLICGLYYRNTKKNIDRDLESWAHISALFYLGKDDLNAKEYNKIKKRYDNIVGKTSYQIYNKNNSVVYGNRYGIIEASTLDKIREEKNHSFSNGEFLCYGLFYEDNQGDFVIVTREKKILLEQQIGILLRILVPLFIAGMLAIIILSRGVARIAYRPFSRVINQVKNISTNNLDVRIESSGTEDELQSLIDTFNELLAKISETIVVQKNFVSYVSHEFKTPLASMLGNLEVFAMKERSHAEYHQLSGNLISQVKQMKEILDTLIVISDLGKNGDIRANIRVDEIVWEIIAKVQESYPRSIIHVNINIPVEKEYLMSVPTDRTQLLMALFNLVENAVKYSQGKDVNIDLYTDNEQLYLLISDKGIGIPSSQLADISKPFYRADNTGRMQGNGLGLSLALRVLEKNKIGYRIESEEKAGTQVCLNFYN